MKFKAKVRVSKPTSRWLISESFQFMNYSSFLPKGLHGLLSLRKLRDTICKAEKKWLKNSTQTTGNKQTLRSSRIVKFLCMCYAKYEQIRVHFSCEGTKNSRKFRKRKIKKFDHSCMIKWWLTPMTFSKSCVTSKSIFGCSGLIWHVRSFKNSRLSQFHSDLWVQCHSVGSVSLRTFTVVK